MAQLSVEQTAARLGVSAQRVRQRIRDGHLPAVRIGSQWVVDELDLARAPRVSRPMAPRIAWAFAALLDGGRPSGVIRRELSRLRRRADRLVSPSVPRDETISSWLADRASIHHYSVATMDAADLRGDPRIALSGVSGARSELSAGGEVEGYVRSDHLRVLEADYLLVAKSDHAAAAANVVLRSIDPLLGLPVEIPRLMIVVDLIDRRESRAATAADRLLDEVLREGLWMQ